MSRRRIALDEIALDHDITLDDLRTLCADRGLSVRWIRGRQRVSRTTARRLGWVSTDAEPAQLMLFAWPDDLYEQYRT